MLIISNIVNNGNINIIKDKKEGDENDKNKRTETICWTNPI